eukprot:3478356-Pleurochrysis_carterae.AAC.1
MVRENNGGATEGQHNAYDAVESSALDVLIDVCARYIRMLGTLGAQAAQEHQVVGRRAIREQTVARGVAVAVASALIKWFGLEMLVISPDMRAIVQARTCGDMHELCFAPSSFSGTALWHFPMRGALAQISICFE